MTLRVPAKKFRLYWSTEPRQSTRSVDFGAEEDVLRAAHLLMRAGISVWCIESPDGAAIGPEEIKKRLSRR